MFCSCRPVRVCDLGLVVAVALLCRRGFAGSGHLALVMCGLEEIGSGVAGGPHCFQCVFSIKMPTVTGPHELNLFLKKKSFSTLKSWTKHHWSWFIFVHPYLIGALVGNQS